MGIARWKMVDIELRKVLLGIIVISVGKNLLVHAFSAGKSYLISPILSIVVLRLFVIKTKYGKSSLKESPCV